MDWSDDDDDPLSGMCTVGPATKKKVVDIAKAKEVGKPQDRIVIDKKLSVDDDDGVGACFDFHNFDNLSQHGMVIGKLDWHGTAKASPSNHSSDCVQPRLLQYDAMPDKNGNGAGKEQFETWARETAVRCGKELLIWAGLRPDDWPTVIEKKSELVGCCLC